jgi:glutamate-1-semialdehyde 2,1-aminomutase
VPRELRGTAVTFNYGDRAAFDAIVAAHGDRLAAVIMEPCRYLDPEPGYLEYVRDKAHQAGAMLIFDEITIGWRLCHGGSHLRFGVNPDIAVFAKALGNGHPIGAVIGTKEAMDGAQGSFISSTYWTEGVGPVAALATLRKLRENDVTAHVARIGELMKEAWRAAGARHKVDIQVAEGYPCLAHFALPNELKTIYTTRMLKHGFLAGAAIYPTLAHTEEIVSRYAEALDAVFADIAEAVDKNDWSALLEGPPAHQGFRRLL